jgi:hypothetical protein
MPSLCLFGGDKDQVLAFVQIVSAFVIKLHEKAFDSTNLRKRYRNGKLKLDFSKPIHEWVKQGKTDHLAVLKDNRVVSLLKHANSIDGRSDNINLKGLGLDASLMVEMKWKTTNDTQSVEMRSIKLIQTPTEGISLRNNFLKELKTHE